MSKLKCCCGHIISDTTDYISYKGHIIPDQDECDYFDRAEELIKSDNPDKNSLMCDFLYSVNDKIIYQCTECGRLYIEDNNKLFCFMPENHNNTKILNSVHGEKWKGFLHAEYNDKKPEWRECKGYVRADVNCPCESIHSDDMNEITDGYYRILDELKKAGVIRYATLKINGKIVHEWDNP
ncbi:MAG: hypothetical protein NC177_05145 [Ruminococcus flavefaciens]|nr:hypothetical protein [Ruminococcus flavefaciens]